MEDDGDDPTSRPTLSDVLAALVTSVSRARVQADLSSAEVARLYKRHDLLRAMPVPRLRLNSVQVSLPVVVTAVRKGEGYTLRSDEHLVGEGVKQDVVWAIASLRTGLLTDIWNALGMTTPIPRGDDALEGARQKAPTDQVIDPATEAGKLLQDLSKTLEDASKQLEKVIPEEFSREIRGALEPLRARSAGRDLTADLGVHEECARAVKGRLKRAIDVRRGKLRLEIEELERKPSPGPEEGEQLQRFRALAVCYPMIMGEKKLSGRTWFGELGSYTRELYERVLVAIPNLIDAVGERASAHTFDSDPRPPEVEIAVHTADVKNEGNPGTITRIIMTMSEEGLEWVAESGGDGESQWKLVPE